jgi:hypothetical protein
MLERLSSSWGVEKAASGKTVWFELREGAGGLLADDEDWEALADLAGAHPPVEPPSGLRGVGNTGYARRECAHTPRRARGLAA